MTTTPEPTKGVPKHDGNSPLTVRADHNALAAWVRDNADASVATVGDLPPTGNWVGRRRFVGSDRIDYVWDGSGWVTSTDKSASITPGTGMTIVSSSLEVDRSERVDLYLQVSKASTISSGD